MGFFTKKCPYCNGSLVETGYSFPYPQYRCNNCVRNNKAQDDIEELKKQIQILKNTKKQNT